MNHCEVSTAKQFNMFLDSTRFGILLFMEFKHFFKLLLNDTTANMN